MNTTNSHLADGQPASPTAAPALVKPSLEDRVAIIDLIAGLGLHTDECEWDRVEAGLMPEVTADYVSLKGGVPQTVTSQELVAQYRALMPGFDANQHMITTVDIGLRDPDHAVVRSQVRAVHRLGPSLWIVGGLYTHEVLRTPDGWRVSYVKFSLAYEEGDRAVLAQAAERAKRIR